MTGIGPVAVRQPRVRDREASKWMPSAQQERLVALQPEDASGARGTHCA